MHQMLYRITGTCDFFDGFDASGLFKEEAKFGAGRSLIINNQGMQHVSVLVSLRAAKTRTGSVQR